MGDLLICGAAVADPEGLEERDGLRSVLVRGERIAGVFGPDVPPPGRVPVLDARR